MWASASQFVRCSTERSSQGVSGSQDARSWSIAAASWASGAVMLARISAARCGTESAVKCASAWAIASDPPSTAGSGSSCERPNSGTEDEYCRVSPTQVAGQDSAGCGRPEPELSAAEPQGP